MIPHIIKSHLNGKFVFLVDVRLASLDTERLTLISLPYREAATHKSTGMSLCVIDADLPSKTEHGTIFDIHLGIGKEYIKLMDQFIPAMEQIRFKPVSISIVSSQLLNVIFIFKEYDALMHFHRVCAAMLTDYIFLEILRKQKIISRELAWNTP